MTINYDMRRMGRQLAATAMWIAIVYAGPAAAQGDREATEDQWQFSAAIYLWGAGIGGHTITGSEVEVGFSTLVDNLKMGFMGAFEARKNRWTILGDVVYLNLSSSKTVDLVVEVGSIPIPVTTAAKLDLKGLVTHVGGGYNLYTNGPSTLDLVGGARNLHLDMDLFLELSALGPGLSRTISETVDPWDAFIGLKGQAWLGEKWFIPYWFDVGAGDSKSTWQATAGIGYKAGRVVDLALVYRHLEWDLDSTRVIDDINFSGPTFGVIFRW